MTPIDDAALPRDGLLAALRDAGAVYVRAMVGTAPGHFSEYVRAHKGAFEALVRGHGPRTVYSVTRAPNGALYVG